MREHEFYEVIEQSWKKQEERGCKWGNEWAWERGWWRDLAKCTGLQGGGDGRMWDQKPHGRAHHEGGACQGRDTCRNMYMQGSQILCLGLLALVQLSSL